ncbi:MAG: M48 family metalloprotease [Armatimonadota bacterium]
MGSTTSMRWPLRALLILALAAGCAPAFASLETDLEEGLGRFLAEAFIAQRGRLSQPPITAWIDEVGAKLLAHTPRRDLHYRFVVLDSPEANGFAFPGGWVFITAGLLESARSDDEIAAVMAHELGHLVDRDFQRMVGRTLLWLGVAELVRDSGRDDLVPLVQGVQLVNTLRHSRRQEAQADQVGAGIAWAAGYDPAAMLDFLHSAPAWSYLETVFATHPHPDQRKDWIRSRVAELRAADPDGALALARSLVDRGRYQRARALLSEPLPPACEPQRRALVDRIAALAAPPAADALARTGLAEAALAELKSARTALEGAEGNTEGIRSQAWRRLRDMWESEELGRALVVAQALDPELTDAGYLALLAQTVDLVYRSVRGGNLIARTLSLRAENTRGLLALMDDLAVATAPVNELDLLASCARQTAALAWALAESAQAEVCELAKLAGAYRQAAQQVAPLLLELAAAGEGDPMGRLVFSRFMLLQAQVAALAARVDGLDGEADVQAGRTWQAAIDVHRLGLNLAGLGAPPPARPLLVRAVARRLRISPGELKTLWRSDGGLGDAAAGSLGEALGTSDGEFDSRLRALHITLRLSFCDTQEQKEVGAKGPGMSVGP